jgi:hypothetical protein
VPDRAEPGTLQEAGLEERGHHASCATVKEHRAVL